MLGLSAKHDEFNPEIEDTARNTTMDPFTIFEINPMQRKLYKKEELSHWMQLMTILEDLHPHDQDRPEYNILESCGSATVTLPPRAIDKDRRRRILEAETPLRKAAKRRCDMIGGYLVYSIPEDSRIHRQLVIFDFHPPWRDTTNTAWPDPGLQLSGAPERSARSAYF